MTALVLLAALGLVAVAALGVVLAVMAYRVGYAKGTEDAAIVVLVRCSGCPLDRAPWRMEDRWLD